MANRSQDKPRYFPSHTALRLCSRAQPRCITKWWTVEDQRQGHDDLRARQAITWPTIRPRVCAKGHARGQAEAGRGQRTEGERPMSAGQKRLGEFAHDTRGAVECRLIPTD